MTDTYLVVFASVLLMLALLIFLISYVSITRTRHHQHHQTVQLESAVLSPAFLSGESEEHREGQKQGSKEGDLSGCASEAASEKGPNVDLHAGSKNAHDEARLRLKNCVHEDPSPVSLSSAGLIKCVMSSVKTKRWNYSRNNQRWTH